MCDALGHGNNGASAKTPFAAINFAQEVSQHRFAKLEIANNAFSHRPHDGDRIGRAAEHLSSEVSNGAAAAQNAAAIQFDGDDGRFIQNHAFSGNADQGIGGPQVDGKIGTQEPK